MCVCVCVCLHSSLCTQISSGLVTAVCGVSDAQQSPWPLSEPVNGAAVDKRGEHPTPGPEGVTHRAHADHYVQSVLDPADEVGEYAVPVPLWHTVLLGHRPHLGYDHLILIWFKQVRDLIFGVERMVYIRT